MTYWNGRKGDKKSPEKINKCQHHSGARENWKRKRKATNSLKQTLHTSLCLQHCGALLSPFYTAVISPIILLFYSNFIRRLVIVRCDCFFFLLSVLHCRFAYFESRASLFYDSVISSESMRYKVLDVFCFHSVGVVVDFIADLLFKTLSLLILLIRQPEKNHKSEKNICLFSRSYSFFSLFHSSHLLAFFSFAGLNSRSQLWYRDFGWNLLVKSLHRFL